MTAFLVDMHPGRPETAEITRKQAAVLEAFLKDGADDRTIARRIGSTYYAVQGALNEVLKATGMPSRTALAIALLRHDLVLTVRAPHAGKRATRKAAA